MFHSAVLAYLDAGARAAFVDLVATLPGHWISNEGAGVLPATAGLVLDEVERGFVVMVDGTPRAYADPHGRSMSGV